MRNRSAACGAWRDFDGDNAHRYCDGSVLLPNPVCDCHCHSVQQLSNETIKTILHDHSFDTRTVNDKVQGLVNWTKDNGRVVGETWEFVPTTLKGIRDWLGY